MVMNLLKDKLKTLVYCGIVAGFREVRLGMGLTI